MDRGNTPRENADPVRGQDKGAAVNLTLDERVLLAIERVNAKDLSKDMLMAFGRKGESPIARSNRRGNLYRWLLKADGTVLRWYPNGTLRYTLGTEGEWVPASQRMTKIIRAKAFPEYV
jgi:hypothetical protein